MTGVKEINLPDYAERFAGAGVQQSHSMGGGHMLVLAAWEPRSKAVVATSTGIDSPKGEKLLSQEEARSRYDQLVVLSGLRTTKYAGGRHLEEAAKMAIDWFKRHL